MKIRLVLSAGFLVFLTVSMKAQEKKVDTVVVKTQIYCSHCKECETCAGKLEKELIFDKGIRKITIDDKANTITVVYNSRKTNPARIRNAITNLGYDADEVKARPENVAKLDECCRKINN